MTDGRSVDHGAIETRFRDAMAVLWRSKARP
jgi:hypothetical protein